MNRRQRVSVVFVKRDWGSGRLTWRRVSTIHMDGKFTTRRLAKIAWLSRQIIKPY